jgi:putative tryptophan/tyrosine transport system substrate-binding protein
MRQRNLTLILGLLVVVAMGTAHAQQSGKVYRIALVDPAAEFADTTSDFPAARAFCNELRRLGYIEGQNLLIERYSGEGRAAHYPDLARDVVRRNPDLIIAYANELVLDFKAATTTIPIVGVFAFPVETGIVSSLARPGGNVTGASIDAAGSLWLKRLQLFHEVVLDAKRLESSNGEKAETRGKLKDNRVRRLFGRWELPYLLARRSIFR